MTTSATITAGLTTPLTNDAGVALTDSLGAVITQYDATVIVQTASVDVPGETTVTVEDE